MSCWFLLSGIWPSASDGKTLFKPVMAFMGHRADTGAAETSEIEESSEHPSNTEGTEISSEESSVPAAEVIAPEKDSEDPKTNENDSSDRVVVDVEPSTPRELDEGKAEGEASPTQMTIDLSIAGNENLGDSPLPSQQKDGAEMETSDELQSNKSNLAGSDGAEQVVRNILCMPDELQHVNDSEVGHSKEDPDSEQLPHKVSLVHYDVPDSGHLSLEPDPSVVIAFDTTQSESHNEVSDEHLQISTSGGEDPARDAESGNHDIGASSESLEMSVDRKDLGADNNEHNRTINVSSSSDSTIELEKVRKEMKLMEAALQGAARQSQVFIFLIIPYNKKL